MYIRHCSIVETWFDVNTSNKLVGLLLGTEFQWFGKEREEKKRYSREVLVFLFAKVVVKLL